MNLKEQIIYTYEHSLNSRSKSMISKRGVYYGKINHTYRYRGEQKCRILLEGNNNFSVVPLSKIKLIQ